MTGFAGAEQLADAIKGSDVVVIPAGVPRKPGLSRNAALAALAFSLQHAIGMTRDDLFNTNAKIVQDLVEATGK